MKQIMFARTFPSYHPRKGEPTYFVEKMMKWYMSQVKELSVLNIPQYQETVGGFSIKEFDGCGIKYHTIRSGYHWKQGDEFAPKVWTGKPYNSPTYQFLPPIKVKQTYNIMIRRMGNLNNNISTFFSFAGKEVKLMGQPVPLHLRHLSVNDGLGFADFSDWFTKSPEFKREGLFQGQIICWEPVNYID